MSLLDKPCYPDMGCDKSQQCDIWGCPTDGLTYGHDPNMCNGILSYCDPTIYRCDKTKNDPGINTLNQFLGCNRTDSGNSSCREYTTAKDELSRCRENCWTAGGVNFVQKQCNTLATKELCGLANYFCTWNGTKCTTFLDDPYDTYVQNKGSGPPKVLVGVGNSNCTDTDSCRKFSGYAKINCAQGTSNPYESTSYDPRSRICRIQWGTEPGIYTNELTIRTPRCQYVPKSNMCTFRKDGDTDKFLCGRTLFNYIHDNVSLSESGFCTWCTNQSETPEQRNLSGTGFRLPNEWTSTNRCTNYNECEVPNSEELYNKCIWEQSLGRYGQNPDSVAKDPTLLQKGFHYDRNITEQLNLFKKCSTVASPTKSNVATYVPGSSITTPRGTEAGTWYTEESSGVVQNYYCTWCPSLQEKIIIAGIPTDTIIVSVSVAVSVVIIIGVIVMIIFLK